MRSTLIAIGLSFLSANAMADHGVREISQMCAEQTGCFPGDTPGFPVQIDAPGSYRLIGDLDIPAGPPYLTGIEIGADFVTLDLAGFHIRGTNECTGIPPLEDRVCDRGSFSETDRAIHATGIGADVRNGHASGFGRYGIELEVASLLRDVHLADNGYGGANLVEGGLLLRNRAILNDGTALNSAGPGVVRQNIVRGGVLVGDQSVVDANTVRDSRTIGISLLAGSVVTNNTAIRNGQFGIRGTEAPSVLTIRRNTVVENGINPNASEFQNDGIECHSICNVTENTSRGNVGFGIDLFRESAYSLNVVTENGGGAVNGGENRNGNYCAGPNVTLSTCP